MLRQASPIPTSDKKFGIDLHGHEAINKMFRPREDMTHCVISVRNCLLKIDMSVVYY